ncbi:MAG: 4-carboxymuconolactone decarboxylase [Deltaproteobacteria bacterium]|jgi:alkylhydroperoxidase/carboxymuconolactone decarboxylase family protein YurZ|nr:4-carboxymuconolactone decarboxylase [Deltaproteobacteria bacterium]
MSEEVMNPIEQLTFPPEIEEEMQDLLLRVGGEFWGREGLEPSTRSLATMAVLCARGQQDELAIHVRLGQEQWGVSRQQICELIRHCGLYAGFPAMVSGFRTVARVFQEMDAEQP